MSLYEHLAMYWRFARGMKKFLKEPISLEQSRQIIWQRLANREHNFLLLVKRAVYDNHSSPYLKLLRQAGCEYGDFEHMVVSDGIEPSLKKLQQDGVYLTVEEFKGRKEVIRGGNSFKFKERDFDNPYLAGHIEASSGASRSAGTRTVYDFSFMSEHWTPYAVIGFDAFDVLDVPVALWMPVMPGGGPMRLLSFTKAGKIPSRWFSPVEQASFRPSLKNRMGTAYIVRMGRISGKKLPGPEYVAINDARILARWIGDTIRESGGCCLYAYTSLAVRVCQAARDEGLDINGASFMIGGEPLTLAKKQEIEAAGARVFSVYGIMETGVVGYGCTNPAAVDEVHLNKDTIALIQYPRQVPHAEASVDAFLFTTLLPSAPKIMLNVESGDYGVMETRQCGCKLEQLGLTDHIYNIRSFDKLTGEGMTIMGTDLVNIVEKILPAKYGGSSTDYQILEEEDEQGHTRLSIVISPGVEGINEDELIRTVLAGLAGEKDTARMMTRIWSQANIFRVIRRQPFITTRGKLLPLHIKKSK